MRIGIVGAGVTGLTIAGELTRRGHQVDVFERSQPGGLAMGFPYRGRPGVYLEKFYHHIFTSDETIIDLIHAHGLGDDLQWLPTNSGLIARGRVWPFGSAMDLLRFSPAGSLLQRLLMGWNLWYFKRTEDWEHLDKIRCRDFFARRGNLTGYRRLWEPLLRQKFADAADDVPASFLWGRIHPRAKSRHKGRESLGYLKGGFQRLFIRMVDAIRDGGGRVHTARPVQRLWSGPQPKLLCGNDTHTFDRIVWTASTDGLLRAVPDVPAHVAQKARAIEYMAVTQLIVITKRRQSDYYWLNNADPELSFGGLIEHTNMVPPEDFGGQHILYVVNYHRPGDPRFSGKTASALLEYHTPSLKRILPRFRRDEIIRLHCIRDTHSSPLYDLGFAERKPPYQGWLPNVDVCGMAQVYPEDRNMDHCARNALGYVAESLEGRATGSRQLRPTA